MFYSWYEKDTKCPLAISCFKDYNEGIEYAKSVNKPVLVDFTGWACVSCRAMEETVWPNPNIYQKLNNEFVLISLYVDDKQLLPLHEQDTILINGREKYLTKKGKKWHQLQYETFKHLTQPYYALLSPDEFLLNNPVSYTPDVEKYDDFLKCGLDAFKKLERMDPYEKQELFKQIKTQKTL